MSSAPEFRWNDSFLLGYAPMDDTHREFVEVVEAMRTASDDELAGHIEVFLKHAEEHFEQERALMAATGFPAMDCHVKEHNAVLHSVRQVKELLATKGDACGLPRAGRRTDPLVPRAHRLSGRIPGAVDHEEAVRRRPGRAAARRCAPRLSLPVLSRQEFLLKSST